MSSTTLLSGVAVEAVADVPLVLVSVGTDVHPFDRLVGWAGDLARELGPRARVVVQYGYSARPSTRGWGPGAACVDFLPWPEMCALMAAADVVVTHGGPTTIVEARRCAVRPLTVARDPARREHVDNHQQLFTRRLADQGLVELVTDQAALRSAVLAAVAEPELYRLPGGSDEGGGATAAGDFGRGVEELFRAWPETVSQTLEATGPDGTLRLLRPGDPVPAGAVPVRTYRLLPSAHHPRYLADARADSALGSTVGGYARLRPPVRRGLRRALAAGLRLRAAVAPAAGTAQLVATGSRPPESLEHVLETLLGFPVRLAVPVRGGDPHHKPTVQVLDAAGRTVAFAKLGPTPATAARVRNEAAALTAVAGGLAAGGRLAVPAVLGQATWGSTEVLLIAALPPDARSVGLAELPETVAAARLLLATVPVRVAPLRASGFVVDLLARARELRWPAGEDRARDGDGSDGDGSDGDGGDGKHPLAAAADRFLEAHGDQPVTLGRQHGDWVPWNLARTPGTLWAFDLEHSSSDAPLGLDLARGHTHVQRQLTGADVGIAMTAARDRAEATLAELGLSGRAAASVLALHSMDEAVRALSTVVGGRDAVGGSVAVGAGGARGSGTARWPVGTGPSTVRALADRAG